MTQSIVFMYAGQGSQYYGMGKALFEQEPVFREWMLRMDQTAVKKIGKSVVETLYDAKKTPSEPFQRTTLSHPAIYMIETAMTELLCAHGIHPDYVLGESLGEFAAATAAGMIRWEDGLEMVIEQAAMLDRFCKAGGMLAILDHVSIYNENKLLNSQSELAAQLSDNHFVVSGEANAIQAIYAHLQEQRIIRDLLPVSHAFHSRMIEGAAAPYKQYLSQKRIEKGRIPIISGVDGHIRQELTQDYFWDVVRQPIAWLQSVDKIEKFGPAVYIDLGPSGGMANMVKRRISPASSSQTNVILSRFHQDVDQWNKIKYWGQHLQTQRAHSVVDHEKIASHQTLMLSDKEERPMRAYVFPGQGSQHRGMGGDLFDAYPEITEQADRILGYSIKELCLQDPNQQLGLTQFTQPALYVVNTLHYLKARDENGRPDIVAGHSLGEYNALYAAGAFSFEVGLQLVKRRGELMSQASGGGMAAVIGMDEEKLRQVLADHGLAEIDVANINSLTQIVISGPQGDIIRAQQALEASHARMVIPLKVSGAFHSRMMTPAYESFASFLDTFTFESLSIPVVSNVTARPYDIGQFKQLLAGQIIQSVRWTDTIRYMMGLGVEAYDEVGPGNVLTKLISSIRKEATPLYLERDTSIKNPPKEEQPLGRASLIDTAGMTLGDSQFKQDYGLRYAYVAGAMYKGIASVEMVVQAGRAGMLGIFGAGGLSIERIEASIRNIQEQLKNGETYGFNLLHEPEHPMKEEQLVDLYLRYGVDLIEASAYMSINAALVRYRASGLMRNPDDSIQMGNRIIAKVSRPEVAEAFLSPAPERVVSKLIHDGLITQEAAALLREVPMADDISVEADSGGHTDHRSPYTLLPSLIRLRDACMKKHGYQKRIRIGAAGGIGTPEAALAAYMMGADYLVTGSINQCTVEADTSEAVKDLLQQAEVQDMDYAPAGDMFELGAKVQVLKKGGLFSARANKLFELYRNVESIDQIDARTRQMLEEKVFHRTFEEVYEEVRQYKSQGEIDKAERDPKHKMALIFKWYFAMSNQAALKGVPEQRVNYQIHCGPALGAFNQWVRGTELESWRSRHVDRIGQLLCDETAELLQQQARKHATTFAFLN